MKAIFLCLVVCVVLANALVPYEPRSCVGCRGLVSPGTRYYDGCNQCECTRWWPMQAMCSFALCEYNRCYKPWSRGG